MPIHDWSKTYAGAFHHFHGTWLFRIAEALNAGLLPPDYYALGEQVVGGAVPDVLALEGRRPREAPASLSREDVAALELPAATLVAVAERPSYPPRPRVIAVRHRSGDRLVAMIEIVSAGNKSDAAELGSLVEKTVVALSKGIHVVLIDLHRPGPFDPVGIHNVIWAELGQPPVPFLDDRPFQIVSYRSAGSVSSVGPIAVGAPGFGRLHGRPPLSRLLSVRSAVRVVVASRRPAVRSASGRRIAYCDRPFIEPRAVGEKLPEAPLFLTPSLLVALPLERTYEGAFAALPSNLKADLTR